MPNFSGGEGELSELYLSETDILERYVGNQLWLWGSNTVGQLGDNSVTHRSSPVQTISGETNWKQISVGVGHSAAIKTDGTLWSWGNNYSITVGGQLGDNTSIHRSSPVQTVAGGTNWKQVSCGSYFTAAIKTDGTLWLWGSNTNGVLGDNTTVSKSSPVQTVSGGTNWKQISGSAAIKTDGTLWLWGKNTDGQLGDNSVTHRSSPVQTVSAGTNWKQVSVSGSGNSTAAIKTDGTLWLWGLNGNGQLGDNSITSRSSPVQTVSGGTNWKQVSCFNETTAAIKTDGTLWLWGKNTDGQLGTNDIVHRSSPVQTVSGGTNWKQVSVGVGHSAAIKTDGTLWSWGSNANGPLGDNTTTAKSSPVQTVAGGTNWKQVSCGSYFTAAITYTES
jgi:alpha-tubulin suppressor-like RCC1 family protein